MYQPPNALIAVDIGNSRVKLARFDRSLATRGLPVPKTSIELPLASNAGDFDGVRFSDWCKANVQEDAAWVVSSVHRGASEQLIAAIATMARELGHAWTVRQLAFMDVPLVIEVDAPERVGMDRLMGAVAADRLRPKNRAAIVVDLGTATKLGLLTEVGAFVGGAILPGLAMSARALEEQTDALPHVDVGRWQMPPQPLGKSTVPAIEAGIFWGTVGAARELIGEYAKGLAEPPAVFVTGGGAPLVAEVLARDNSLELQHLPQLVLCGVAIVAATVSLR